MEPWQPVKAVASRGAIPALLIVLNGFLILVALAALTGMLFGRVGA